MNAAGTSSDRPTIPLRLETLRWEGNAVDGQLWLIDQTKLPGECLEIACREVEQVWEAIRVLRVRGAPAIGLAAAYGVVLGTRRALADPTGNSFWEVLDETVRYLATSRPTAVNLFWALDRQRRVADSWRPTLDPHQIHDKLLAEARSMHDEDREMCRAIGRHGAPLIPAGAGVLTHCNAGGLATSGFGTALAVFFTCQEQGRDIRAFVDETRPLLQGARLTAFELARAGIPTTLLCDSMAAQVMREGRIGAVVVGADRIAANGDTANKIGTYSVAVLANAHGIPFYVAAPTNTFDLTLPTGDGIPIEQRDSREITHGFGVATAPAGIQVYNPAFDVTPAHLIQGIITERGVVSPVTRENVAAVVGGDSSETRSS